MLQMPYEPVTWNSNDSGSTDKLQQMAENDEALYEMAVDTYYGGVFGPVESGIKIWAGSFRLPITGTDRSIIQVNFEGFFAPECRPVVNCTLGRRQTNRMWVSVKGPGAENWPVNNQCEIHAIVDPDADYKFAQNLPVHVIAIGY